MDPQEYADARWHALLRAAVDLGVDEDDAPALVRRILAANHRRIRRAEDPDPLVHAALEEAVRGPRERPRPPWRAVGGALAALAAVLAVVALTRPDEPPIDHLDDDQVPSLFGFGRLPAENLLRDLGLEVTVEPMRACEVADRVIGSDPQRGTTYEPGDPITLYTAVPSSITCLTDPDAWAATGVLDALRSATSRVRLTDDRPLTYAVPALRIIRATEGLGACGVPDPAVAGTGDAFAALIFSPTRTGCPLRLEVYRDNAHRVAAVALYAPSS